MVHFGILMKAVLGLVWFVCQLAQSLDTGYVYPGNIRVREDVLYNDLKCAYLYGGLTHMLVIKYLVSPPFVLHIETAIAYISKYTRISRYQIDSLYRLKVMRMDGLWLINLYTGIVQGFYEHSSNKMEDSQKIIGTHNYVIAQLRKDLTDCRKDNAFNNENKIISNKNRLPNELTYLMNKNFADVEDLLTKNDIICDRPFNKYVGETLRIKSLFLNNLGLYDVFKEDLMDVFNVQVDWSGTSERLAKSWHDKQILNWIVDKFENIKIHYKLIFNFLKIILLRLTLKHLYYLKPYFGTDDYVHYAKEWYNIVQQFGEMLSLSEDLHVINLLYSLDNLVKQEEKIDSVFTYLFVILNELCLPLGCDATKPFELNEKEFSTPFKSYFQYKVNRLEIIKSPVRIEYYSLENTKIFLHYLSRMFQHVDFTLVRLFMEYINEEKP